MDYLDGIRDALSLAFPHGPTPMQILEVAIKNTEGDRRLEVARCWRDRNPEFLPTKRQRKSFEEDWGIGWPIAEL